MISKNRNKATTLQIGDREIGRPRQKMFPVWTVTRVIVTMPPGEFSIHN
jgi:hypothetical protein